MTHAGDSAGAGVSAEPTAGPRDRGHYGTAASRRAALTARGRRVGGWPGRGLTAAPAAEEAADPAEDAAAVAAADEEADEEETMLPESKAADAADPLIEAGCAHVVVCSDRGWRAMLGSVDRPSKRRRRNAGFAIPGASGACTPCCPIGTSSALMPSLKDTCLACPGSGT